MIEQLKIILYTNFDSANNTLLSNYFGKKQVLRGTLGEIWRIQIQIYPKTSIESIYGALSLTNKVSAHGLG